MYPNSLMTNAAYSRGGRFNAGGQFQDMGNPRQRRMIAAKKAADEAA